MLSLNPLLALLERLTMNKADIEQSVRDLVGDPLKETITFSSEQVDQAIHFACMNYCQKTRVSYQEDSIPMDGSGKVKMLNQYIEIIRVKYA